MVWQTHEALNPPSSLQRSTSQTEDSLEGIAGDIYQISPGTAETTIQETTPPTEEKGRKNQFSTLLRYAISWAIISSFAIFVRFFISVPHPPWKNSLEFIVAIVSSAVAGVAMYSWGNSLGNRVFNHHHQPSKFLKTHFSLSLVLGRISDFIWLNYGIFYAIFLLNNLSGGMLDNHQITNVSIMSLIDAVVFISLHLAILRKNYKFAEEPLTWAGVLRFALGSFLFVIPSTFIIFWFWGKHSFIPYTLWTPILFMFTTHFMHPPAVKPSVVEGSLTTEESFIPEGVKQSHPETMPTPQKEENSLLQAL